MRRLALVCLLAAVTIGARDPIGATPSPTVPTRTAGPGWDPAALATANELAEKVRAAGLGCRDYEPWDFAVLSGEYARKGLARPNAVASCTTKADEDLTFEVFADEAGMAAFLDRKRDMLCASARRQKIPYDGFPYVVGGTWIVEPDLKETAERLAPALGGRARQSDPC